MLWIKAFHFVFVVNWFAGIFYLPRLFVYHAMAEDKISIERFKIMERKLYRGIMTPSAIIATALGFWLVFLNPHWYFSQGWFHAKLALVLALFIYHFYCYRFLKAFQQDRNQHGHVFYRWFNEAPVVLLVGIGILVIVKPF
ncbi:MAG: protoporphyrinogen oxidase HemJ [Gammaproteobacteria bacterium]|nr:protoporphyrinogen oxidase HemJ [Gammaproteobacteria bacterium]